MLHQEPSLEELPKDTPWTIRQLLERCLRKDPRMRLQHTGDARIEIHQVLSEPSDYPPVGAATATPVSWRRTIPWAIAVLAVGMVILSFWEPPSAPPTPKRFSISLTFPFASGAGSPRLALSADGDHLAYLGRCPGHKQEIYHRPLAQFEASPIEGTEGAGSLFFSPDGKWVGFYADRTTLKKVPLAGGPALPICSVERMCGASLGCRWQYRVCNARIRSSQGFRSRRHS